MAKLKDADTDISGDTDTGADKGGDDAVSVSELVRMVRADDSEPNTADVHPDEVSNYQAGGWIVESPLVAE